MQLNPQQLQVVHSPLENSLVLAGAGTGKTRVLIERIVHLLTSGQMQAFNIMAITFTRKAAQEIIERLTHHFEGINPTIAESVTRSITTGTFHSVFYAILRTYVHEFSENDLKPNFLVLDPNAVTRRIKEIVKNGQFPEHRIKALPIKLDTLISNAKENLIDADNFTFEQYNLIVAKTLRVTAQKETEGDLEDFSLVQSIFKAYQDYLIANNQADFADLLLKTYQLIDSNERIRTILQQRYRYILVDECQDMNLIQYKLVEILHQPGVNNVTIIGDDDQSIYGFRGAEVELIQKFQAEFEQVTTYKLEENYRCSPNIIALANQVINYEKLYNVKHLVASKLFSNNEKISYLKYLQQDEMFDQVAKIIYESGDYGNIAVLARKNASLDKLERALNSYAIPYMKNRGYKFFERLEITWVMSYLRLVLNQNDNDAFQRIVNVPKRGIGPSKVVEIDRYASEQRISLFAASKAMLSNGKIKYSSKAGLELSEFIRKIELMREHSISQGFTALVEEIIESFNLKEECKKKSTSDDANSDEHLISLIEMIDRYKPNLSGMPEDFQQQTMQQLSMAYPSLEAEDLETVFAMQSFINTNFIDSNTIVEEEGEDPNRVTLSTIHGVKGLEYHTVFIIDFDENNIPSDQAVTEAEVAEERRIFYVAVTRAKEKLYLCYAHKSQLYGKSITANPSPYLFEIMEVPALTSTIDMITDRGYYANLVEKKPSKAGSSYKNYGSNSYSNKYSRYGNKGSSKGTNSRNRISTKATTPATNSANPYAHNFVEPWETSKGMIQGLSMASDEPMIDRPSVNQRLTSFTGDKAFIYARLREFKQQLALDELDEVTMHNLVDDRLVQQLTDLFTLSKESWLEVFNFTEEKYKLVMQELISKVRNLTLEEFIALIMKTLNPNQVASLAKFFKSPDAFVFSYYKNPEWDKFLEFFVRYKFPEYLTREIYLTLQKQENLLLIHALACFGLGSEVKPPLNIVKTSSIILTVLKHDTVFVEQMQEIAKAIRENLSKLESEL